MPKPVKLKPVPPVKFEHLVAVHRKGLADREAFGAMDLTVSAVSALSRQIESQQILDVTHRIAALANFLHAGNAEEWLMEVTGREYVLLDEGLLHAAAEAPLMEANHIKDMTFEKDTFLPLVLKYAEPEGRA